MIIHIIWEDCSFQVYVLVNGFGNNIHNTREGRGGEGRGGRGRYG